MVSPAPLPHQAEAAQLKPAIRNIRSVNAIFMVVLVIQFTSSIFYNSQILKFFGERVYILLNQSMYITAGLCLFLGTIAGELASIFLTGSIIIYFGAMLYWGAYNSGNIFEHYLILGVTTLSGVPLFSYLLKKGKFLSLRNVILFSSLTYLMIYIFVSIVMPGAESRLGSGGGFIAASGDRDARIFLDAGAASLAIFMGLSGIRHREGLYLNIATLILGFSALYLSHSRLIELRTIFCAIVYFVIPSRRAVRYLFFTIFLCGTIYFISQAALGQNLYESINNDPSSLSRAREFKNAYISFEKNYIFGVGFYTPVSTSLNSGLDYRKIVFWNDLGVYGVLYASGIIGFILYFLMAILMIFSHRRFHRIGMPDALADGINMAAINIAFTSFAVTTIWDCGLEIFAIVLASMAVGRDYWQDRRGL